MLQPQSLSPPIRRMDSLRYTTSAVGALFTKGRKRWSVILFYLSYVRPAFVNSYPGVCEAEGGADARAGGRATAPPSSPRCLSATTPPPPPAVAIHRDPCQEPEHGRTDGRRIYAAALADRYHAVGQNNASPSCFMAMFTVPRPVI